MLHMEGPFLHMVQYNVVPESEDAFNQWYNLHILNVLKVPGYVWARRYVAFEGSVRYLTLYLVDNHASYQRVLVHDISKRLPALEQDSQALRRIPGVHHVCSNVYEQILGSSLGKPLLTQGNPILLVVSDGPPAEHEDEWNRWYNRVHFPNVLRDPWRVMAARFKAIEGAVPPYFPVGPRYIAIYELTGQEGLATFQKPETMAPALRVEFDSPERKKFVAMMRNRARNFYKPISQHWPF